MKKTLLDVMYHVNPYIHVLSTTYLVIAQGNSCVTVGVIDFVACLPLSWLVVCFASVRCM